MAGLSCRRPEGAFYAYAGCAALIGARTPADSLIVDDRTLADYLLEFGVAVIPGACFGLSPYFRLSYACSDSDLAEGLSRIVKACATLTTADT